MPQRETLTLKEGAMRVLWRAYAPSSQRCLCCQSSFCKNRALIVEDVSGQRFPMKASCAAECAANDNVYIPDFSVILALPPAVLPPSLQSAPLFSRQEAILTATLLRTSALPAVGVETEPPSAMKELSACWNERAEIPDRLWHSVGLIVDGCNRQLGRSHSLATRDLMVALTVQDWLHAALETHKIKGHDATIVRSMKAQQADVHRLTHKQFRYLADLTHPSGLEAPRIQGQYLWEASSQKRYLHR